MPFFANSLFGPFLYPPLKSHRQHTTHAHMQNVKFHKRSNRPTATDYLIYTVILGAPSVHARKMNAFPPHHASAQLLPPASAISKHTHCRTAPHRANKAARGTQQALNHQTHERETPMKAVQLRRPPSQCEMPDVPTPDFDCILTPTLPDTSNQQQDLTRSYPASTNSTSTSGPSTQRANHKRQSTINKKSSRVGLSADTNKKKKRPQRRSGWLQRSSAKSRFYVTPRPQSRYGYLAPYTLR